MAGGCAAMSVPVREPSVLRGNVNIAVALFTLVLIAALWSAVMLGHQVERDAVIAAATRQNANLAVAYEEHVVRSLKGLDGVLRFTRHEYQRLERRMNIARYVEEGAIDGSLFGILSVVDERGNIVVSSKPIEPTSYADREFFRMQQQSSEDTLYISRPVLGRVSNTWQVPLSRRIIKPDGSFGGVIVLSVDPGYFVRFYQKVDVGAQGLLVLAGLDGIYRARRVGTAVGFGNDMSGSSLLQEQKKNAAGEFFSESDVDGVARLISYRTLPDFPLVVAVGSAEHEVLAHFRHSRNRDYWLAILASTVILAFAAMLLVTLSRQRRASVALATSEARFRAAFEQAAIGIVHTSLDRRYLQVNQKFCDMLGYAREELLGKPANDLTYPEDREAASTYRQQLLSGAAHSVAAEKRYVRKDGSVIWVNRTVSLVRDPQGQPLYFLRVVEDITERKRLEAELRELAITDMLTGLPNRRAFMNRLEEEHARMQRFDTQQAAVLMLDLDHFKRINDSCGHPAGDAVLRQVAARIRDEIRRVDMCGRIGGEEFAILLAGANAETAREFAERLSWKIADTTVSYEGRDLAVTVSIGIAVMQADDENADRALLRADAALYRAKEAGRDRVEVIA